MGDINKKRNFLHLLAGVGVMLILGLVGQAVSACGSSEKPSGQSSSPGTDVPTYRLQIGEKPSTLNVYVTELPTSGEAALIVEDLQHQYADRDDGYFVQIYCEERGQFEAENRLFMGKFAVGSVGAARTGLPEGAKEIEPVRNAQCPAATLAPADTNALTAEQVVDAVVAAGLPATDPRDNSSRMCQTTGCTQLITTDDFSVYQFPDVESATEWASGWPLGYQNGTIFLRYTEGGSQPTDPALIPQYNAILDRLQAGS